MPWDPTIDYRMMSHSTDCFMSLWRSYKPVICKVHGFAVAGGSDIALCADPILIAEDAKIGYPPARVWGCPTTAMWVYRVGAERAKRMLLTGDGVIAELVLRSFPDSEAVLVDFSDAMIEEASKRLAGYGDRVKLVTADLSDSAWVSALPTDRDYDAVLSACCIHHLEHERKRELYSEVFELLGPGGLFMNHDCVTVCEDSTRELFEKRFVNEILRFEEQKQKGKSREEVEQFVHHDVDEDKPNSLGDQIRWLDEIGFENVDVYFKWLEVVLFGGSKPA